MIEIIPDFETVSACNLKVCGAARYSEDPTTEILTLKYRVAGHGMLTWHPGDDPAELCGWIADSQTIWIAHNTGFEKFIWRNIMIPVYGFPNIPNHRWHDTMAVCAYKVIPLDLEMAVDVMALPYSKDMEGNRLTLSLSRLDKKGNFPAVIPEIIARVDRYCEGDVVAQAALHERLGYLPASERQVWLLDQKINERGVGLDIPLVRKMQEVIDRASGPLTQEFAKLTGGLKMTQGAKVIDWCKSQGFEIPNFQKETLTKLLGESVDEAEDEEESLAGDDADFPTDYRLPDSVRRALRIRQLIGSASIKKLPRMLAMVCADGRARGTMQYHGAGPGRWSGRLLQPHNFPRGTLKVQTGWDDNGDPKSEAPSPDAVVAALMTGDPDYVEMMIGPPVETVVSALRHVLVPAPGRCYVAGDFAGIQARTVLAVAGQHDKTKLMAEGADVYVDMAQDIFRRPIDKKRDPAERQVGKNTVLGCGFQMGWRKFKVKYATDRTDEFCENVINTYRKIWAPRVPKLWYALEDAAATCVHSREPTEAFGIEFELSDMWLTARLPSGRLIWYFNPQPIRKAMPWDETDIRPSWTYQAKKSGQWKTMYPFGGLVTENIVCGIERDLMTDAMFKCEKNGFPIVLLVHDEIVTEPLVADADTLALKQIMEDSPSWSREIGIPVAIEAWKGDRYRK